MQRLCTKLLRPWAARSPPVSLLHSCPLLHRPLINTAPKWTPHSLSPLSPSSSSSFQFLSPALSAFFLGQVRHVSSRERKKRRKPMTPVTSKLKKVKMKAYSSYKGRFRTLNDGTIRRWREGKRHNAHLKSKKSKRRLRQPSTVPAAYAKVMKKLNFCG